MQLELAGFLELKSFTKILQFLEKSPGGDLLEDLTAAS